MSIISSTQPLPLVKAPEVPSAQWTEVQSKRVIRCALAAIALAAACTCGVLAFTATPYFLMPAIPLFIASGVLFWVSSRLIDYDRPEELAAVRSSAAKMTLPQLSLKHGWDNLFRHAILSPSQFDIAYRSHVQGSDFRSLVDYYDMTCGKLQESIRNAPPGTILPFIIPEPKQWKEKFVKETAGMKCTEILAAYPLDQLQRYEILGENEIPVFVKAKETADWFRQRQTECEEEYNRRTETERGAYALTEQLLRQKYDTSSLQLEKDRQHRQSQADLQTEQRIADVQTTAERDLVENFRRSLPQPLLPDDQKRLELVQANCAIKCRAIQQAFQLKKSALYNNDQSIQASLEARIDSLHRMQEAELSAAKLVLNASTKPIRDEMNGKIDAFKKQRDQRIAEINREFDRVRGK